MRPILIGVELRPGGRWAYTYSVRPGERMTLTGNPQWLDVTVADDMAVMLLAKIDTARKPRRPT